MSQLLDTLNLIEYYKRTRGPKRMLRIDNNTYNGGNLGGIIVTKKRKKPYFVASRTGLLNASDAAKAQDAMFPYISNLVPNVFRGIDNILKGNYFGAGLEAAKAVGARYVPEILNGTIATGDALATTAAGQRLTSGLNFATNAVRSSKAWPWIDAGLSSLFAARGADKIRRGDIHNEGDVVETGLDLLPLLQLARPVVNTAGRSGSFLKNKFENILKRSNNFTNTDDVSIVNDLYLDAFLNGTKPMILTIYKGPGSELELNVHNILLGYKYLDLERPFRNGTQTLRYYINEPKLKLTINAYKNLYKSRLNLNTNNVDDIYNYLINNPKLLDPNVNFGTTGLLDIIGINLGYGPKDAILFNLGQFGSPGTKISRDILDRMKFYGYDKSVPGIYNILRKNIERGTLGIKPTSANGSHIGFGYILSLEFPRGLLSNEPLIARGAPEITAENAANITPAQWTAAQDAAIGRGDMAEAQRLRDLHFEASTPNNKLVAYTGKYINGNRVLEQEPVIDFYHNSDESGIVGFDPTKTGKNYKGSTRFRDTDIYVNAFNPASYYGKNKYKLRVYAEKPLIVENVPDFYEGMSENEIEYLNNIKQKYINGNYDAIYGDYGWGEGLQPGEVVVRNPNQIKLADAVTYDDNGVRIPLGERDNFSKNDIRYSWLAPFLGLGTLVSNRKQQ